MTRIAHHLQLRIRPGLGQIIGACGGANHIIAALDDNAGNMGNARHMRKDLAVKFQKARMREIVILEPREGALIFPRPLVTAARRMDRRQRIFPCGPCLAVFDLGLHIAAEKPPVIGRNQIIAFVFGDQVHKTHP